MQMSTPELKRRLRERRLPCCGDRDTLVQSLVDATTTSDSRQARHEQQPHTTSNESTLLMDSTVLHPVAVDSANTIPMDTTIISNCNPGGSPHHLHSSRRHLCRKDMTASCREYKNKAARPFNSLSSTASQPRSTIVRKAVSLTHIVRRPSSAVASKRKRSPLQAVTATGTNQFQKSPHPKAQHYGAHIGAKPEFAAKNSRSNSRVLRDKLLSRLDVAADDESQLPHQTNELCNTSSFDVGPAALPFTGTLSASSSFLNRLSQLSETGGQHSVKQLPKSIVRDSE